MGGRVGLSSRALFDVRMNLVLKKLLYILSLMFFSCTANAAEHIVKAVGVKFEPMFLVIEAGDTVTFTNMPAHLVETIDEMVPEGQPKLLSEMGETVSYTFDVEGIVTYKCTPHWGSRMGGMILVGNPDNLSEILESYLDIASNTGPLKPAKGLVKKFRKMLAADGKI